MRGTSLSGGICRHSRYRLRPEAIHGFYTRCFKKRTLLNGVSTIAVIWPCFPNRYREIPRQNRYNFSVCRDSYEWNPVASAPPTARLWATLHSAWAAAFGLERSFEVMLLR